MPLAIEIWRVFGWKTHIFPTARPPPSVHL